MLEIDQILTSRLAVIIYRLSFLDLEASTTKIGRYFNKKTGSKSKTYNYKYHNLKTRQMAFKNKNFKGYDLSINESELAIRREIAKSLIELFNEPLSPEIIAKVTKLEIEEIKEIKSESIVYKKNKAKECLI